MLYRSKLLNRLSQRAEVSSVRREQHDPPESAAGQRANDIADELVKRRLGDRERSGETRGGAPSSRSLPSERGTHRSDRPRDEPGGLPAAPR
jgi:hypothetical protein